MVFEASRNAIIGKLNAGNYVDALVDLQALRVSVNTHIATLSVLQRGQWADTPLELTHCFDHLNGLTRREEKEQRLVCIDILTRISRI